MPIIPSAGGRVRTYREQLGISRERLAATCDVSVSTISRLELRDHVPGVSILSRIANTLGVTIDELLSDRDERNQRAAS